jgi:hypothetical protein
LAFQYERQIGNILGSHTYCKVVVSLENNIMVLSGLSVFRGRARSVVFLSGVFVFGGRARGVASSITLPILPSPVFVVSI